MTDSLWWISVAAGLSDALNPCVFSVAAVLIIMQNAHERQCFHQMGIFATSTVLTIIFLNAGFDIYVASFKQFDFLIKCLDVVLAFVFLVYAWQMWLQWQAHHKQESIKPLLGQEAIGRVLTTRWLNVFVVVVVGILMGFLVSQWPPNFTFNVLCNSLLVSSRWKDLCIALFLYTGFLFSPVWFTIGVYSDKFIGVKIKALFGAGIMLAASLIAVLILK